MTWKLFSVAASALGLALAVGLASPRAEADADVGYLTVAAEPAARILIDDGDTHLVTPQNRMKLAVGHHRLTLVATTNEKLKRSMGISINKDAETKLSVNLGP